MNTIITSGLTYILTFGTTMGRARTLRVIHADPGLTDMQVRNAMNGLIASSAFAGTAGQINYARRAALEEIITTDIALV